MHIIIGLLGGVLTIMYLLDRLGIDIGGLNPFYWYRRRAFSKKYTSDPIYSVEDPMHIAALLVIGVAKLDGDITVDQKRVAREQFENAFSIDPKEAAGLFGSAAHLLAAPQLIHNQLVKLAEKNASQFSVDQARSVVQMMKEVAGAEQPTRDDQEMFVENIEAVLLAEKREHGAW